LTFNNPYLSAYKEQSTPAYAAEYCNFTSTDPRSASQKKQCRYDLTKLGPCYSVANGFTYGFKDGLPCFFMRMNKVLLKLQQMTLSLDSQTLNVTPLLLLFR
jgi:hypothetical protein